MSKLTRRRCVWLLLALLASTAGVGLRWYWMYEPERIGPANFQRLLEGMTGDEVFAILGDPDNAPRVWATPGGVDLTEVMWGAEGSLYDHRQLGACILISHCGCFSSWHGAVYMIKVEWCHGRVIGAALTRRGDVPLGVWEKVREWVAASTGLRM